MQLEFISHIKLKPAIGLILTWNLILGLPLFVKNEILNDISMIVATGLFASIAFYVRSKDKFVDRFYRKVTDVTLPRIKNGLFFMGSFLFLFAITCLVIALFK
jgi:hypothetical protein